MPDYLRPDEECIIQNVVSRPELNGQICSVENMSFGGGQTTTYNTRLQCTGELVRLAGDKLCPLSEAPDHVLYDDEDLQRDEHPLAAESMLLINLRNRKRCARDPSFTVRIHGLQSASGQLRNGQQAWPSATMATAASAYAVQTARKSPSSSPTFCCHQLPSHSLQTA